MLFCTCNTVGGIHNILLKLDFSKYIIQLLTEKNKLINKLAVLYKNLKVPPPHPTPDSSRVC